MKIQTFSIVAGTRACNARCPFCVSRMTGFAELPERGTINARNFDKAARLAQRAGTTTVLLTGKGEPTLYPDELSEYLRRLRPHAFPLIELQTNGLAIGRLATKAPSRAKLSHAHLQQWYELGLDTIALSVVGIGQQANRQVYHPDYPPLAKTVEYLHRAGFSVRLCVMMMKGAVDDVQSLREVLDFCRQHRVEQLTIRPIRRPAASNDQRAAAFVSQNGIDDAAVERLYDWVERCGTHLLSLMHGAKVFDLDGQNLCLSDCLTVRPDENSIRTLIFYSDGRVSYDWQHSGAVLLGGRHGNASKG